MLVEVNVCSSNVSPKLKRVLQLKANFQVGYKMSNKIFPVKEQYPTLEGCLAAVLDSLCQGFIAVLISGVKIGLSSYN